MGKLTPLEIAIGRFGLHRDIAFRLIMSDYDRSLVWRALLFDGEGWSVRSLAAHLRLPRSTVSRYIAYLVKLGHLERKDGGVYLTEGGRDFLTDVFRCGLEIANGQRVGWPEHIVSKAEAVGYCHEDAATIQFKSDEGFQIN